MQHRLGEALGDLAPVVQAQHRPAGGQLHLSNQAVSRLASLESTSDRRTAETLPAVLMAVSAGAGNRTIATLAVGHRPEPTSDRGFVGDLGRVPQVAASSLSPSSTTDGRGLEAAGGDVDDRTTAALIGGGIGAVVGGIGGAFLGGPVGAAIGAVGGAAVGAGIGALLGGGSAAPSAPVPVALRNGPAHSPIDNATQAGMAIAITMTSSTGVDADMAAVQDSEQVSASFDHTGSYSHQPSARSNNSGFMPGHPIPDDRHTESKATIIDNADNHGGNGSMERDQLDIFTAPAAGITTATAVPHSGYLIRRIITLTGTSISFRLHKGPKKVTVNGFSSDAGPSAAQFDDVTVRP